MDEIPKTATGKFSKVALRELAASRETGTGRPLRRNAKS
jgi:acyl-coenzyme A synthetase/AMP-(fatty) acid ligase